MHWYYWVLLYFVIGIVVIVTMSFSSDSLWGDFEVESTRVALGVALWPVILIMGLCDLYMEVLRSCREPVRAAVSAWKEALLQAWVRSVARRLRKNEYKYGEKPDWF